MAHLLNDDNLSNIVIPLSLGGWARDVQELSKDPRVFPGNVAGCPMVPPPGGELPVVGEINHRWFPMTYLNMDKPFSTSAYLASVFDTVTLPQRLNPSFHPGTRQAGPPAGARYTSILGRPQSCHGFMLGHGDVKEPDTRSPAQLAFPEPSTMQFLLQALNPEGPHRLLTSRAALPFPHPYLTWKDAKTLLHPLTAKSIAHLTPTSWPTRLPKDLRTLPKAIGSREKCFSSFHVARGIQLIEEPKPFSTNNT